MRLKALAFGAALLMIGGPARSADTEAQCQAAVARALSPSLFARYPAAAQRHSFRPASPDVRKGFAHIYRSTIRAQAQLPADFAGHNRMIIVGCGAGATCPAVYDQVSGRITFPREPKVVDQFLMDLGPGNERLLYRPDSRLLIAIGFINEDKNKAGIGYYLWQGDDFRRMRFVPIKHVCSGLN